MPKKESEDAKTVHIDHAISPQAHTPMYLMHKYWARKPHNVVGEYIEHYSKKGEIVLDPFAGSGVTAIEALRNGRKAIAIDIDPISTFITRMTLKPIDTKKFKEAFKEIEQNIREQIENLYSMTCPDCGGKCQEVYVVWEDVIKCPKCDKEIPFTKAKVEKHSYLCSCGSALDTSQVVSEEPIEIGYFCEKCLDKSGAKVRFQIKKSDLENDRNRIIEISEKEIPYWYPKDAKLVYSDGSQFKEGTHQEQRTAVKDLFTKRSLIALSILFNEITKIDDDDIRDLMKLTFSSNLHNVSKLNPVHQPRWKKGQHPSTSWIVHRYWIPPLRVELPIWFYFKERYKHILKGKKESNRISGHYKEAKSFEDLKNDANVLISTQSSLSLSSPTKIEKESVDYAFTDPPYGGSIQYGELSALWASWLRGKEDDPRFELKFDEEITINDAQKKDFDYYHKMLKASFEQVYNVLKSGRWLTVTFHNTDIKIYNSIIKAVVLAGFDLEKVIYQPPARPSAKGLLQPYGSAVGDYYIRFGKPEKEEKLLSEAEIDKERYERIVVDTVKHIIAERREPVAYSTIINSYPTIFAQLKKNGYPFSAPEGIEKVLRNHLNNEFVLEDVKDAKGKTIGKKWWLKEKLFLESASLSERVEAAIIGVLNKRVVASFDDILEEIFTRFQNALTPDTQSIKSTLEEYAEKTDGKWQLKKEMRVRQSQHNQIVGWLVDIGKKVGFDVYADLPEYRGKRFDLPLSKDKIDRIREIDALWLKNNEVVYEFEVENSTGISDAIIRGSNLPSTSIKRYIVIPEERKNLLMMKIAEPILKENIEHFNWNFIFYDAFLSFYEKNSKRRTIDASEIDKLANLSTLIKHEQQTLGQFASAS